MRRDAGLSLAMLAPWRQMLVFTVESVWVMGDVGAQKAGLSKAGKGGAGQEPPQPESLMGSRPVSFTRQLST